jgi:hypothetical protein
MGKCTSKVGVEPINIPNEETMSKEELVRLVHDIVYMIEYRRTVKSPSYKNITNIAKKLSNTPSESINQVTHLNQKKLKTSKSHSVRVYSSKKSLSYKKNQSDSFRIKTFTDNISENKPRIVRHNSSNTID